MVSPFPAERRQSRSSESFRTSAGRRPVSTVLLIGNPNVGKSLLFKNLTHRYVNVSNFPGTTVEVTRARSAFGAKDVEIVDSPGINDLSPRSDEARVTRALLEKSPGATVVQVADGPRVAAEAVSVEAST